MFGRDGPLDRPSSDVHPSRSDSCSAAGPAAPPYRFSASQKRVRPPGGSGFSGLKERGRRLRRRLRWTNELRRRPYAFTGFHVQNCCRRNGDLGPGSPAHPAVPENTCWHPARTPIIRQHQLAIIYPLENLYTTKEAVYIMGGTKAESSL